MSIFEQGQIEQLLESTGYAPPPDSAADAFSHPTWAYWVAQYVAQDVGDDKASAWSDIYLGIAQGEQFQELYARYLRDGGGAELFLPEDLVPRLEEAYQQQDEDAQLLEELGAASLANFESYIYGGFRQNVQLWVDASTQQADGPVQVETGSNEYAQVGGYTSSDTDESETSESEGSDGDESGEGDGDGDGGGSGGARAPRQYGERAAVRLVIGNRPVQTSADTVRDLNDQLAQYGFGDINGLADHLIERVRGGERGEPTEIFYEQGGCQIGLSAYLDTSRDNAVIVVTLAGTVSADSLVDHNDQYLHRLTNDGDFTSYTQCGEVVMLEPAGDDPRFALLRYAAQLAHGLDSGSTLASITRSNRRMRTDALKVVALDPSLKDAFKKAIREVTDKTIEWVN